MNIVCDLMKFFYLNNTVLKNYPSNNTYLILFFKLTLFIVHS